MAKTDFINITLSKEEAKDLVFICQMEIDHEVDMLATEHDDKECFSEKLFKERLAAIQHCNSIIMKLLDAQQKGDCT